MSELKARNGYVTSYDLRSKGVSLEDIIAGKARVSKGESSFLNPGSGEAERVRDLARGKGATPAKVEPETVDFSDPRDTLIQTLASEIKTLTEKVESLTKEPSTGNDEQS